jgi:hypothetical protein
VRSGVKFEFFIGETIGRGAALCLAEGLMRLEEDMTWKEKQGSICGLA